jgi:hypothetical protein
MRLPVATGDNVRVLDNPIDHNGQKVRSPRQGGSFEERLSVTTNPAVNDGRRAAESMRTANLTFKETMCTTTAGLACGLTPAQEFSTQHGKQQFGPGIT